MSGQMAVNSVDGRHSMSTRLRFSGRRRQVENLSGRRRPVENLSDWPVENLSGRRRQVEKLSGRRRPVENLSDRPVENLSGCYSLVSEASREVAILTERKNLHTPYMVSKNLSVHLL